MKIGLCRSAIYLQDISMQDYASKQLQEFSRILLKFDVKSECNMSAGLNFFNLNLGII